MTLLRIRVQYQGALSIGFLLGVIFVMANQMLIIFGIFCDRTYNDPSGQKEADTAVAVFAFFLFGIYSVFGTMLAVFR